MWGVSGGERTKVSIGQEMLVNPSLMLLDEPTPGLDSTIVQGIVRELSGLAKGGRTIVLMIHQPSSRLFYMFDKVVLLSEGNPLYIREGRGMMEYFESGIGLEEECGDSDTVGLMFFYSSFWGDFPTFNAIFTCPVERMMLEKERSSGTYRLSSYFVAGIVGDLPIELIPPTIYLIITYWMSGMSPDPVSFIRALFALVYSVLACQGVGLAIGAIVMDMHKAATFGSVVVMSFLLAGGYYIRKVPAFVAWTRYLSISYYTYKLLLGSQFDKHSRYPWGDRESCLVIEYRVIREVGLGGQAVAVAVLGLMIISYRAVAYVALMRVGVTKA